MTTAELFEMFGAPPAQAAAHERRINRILGERPAAVDRIYTERKE